MYVEKAKRSQVLPALSVVLKGNAEKTTVALALADHPLSDLPEKKRKEAPDSKRSLNC